VAGYDEVGGGIGGQSISNGGGTSSETQEIRSHYRWSRLHLMVLVPIEVLRGAGTVHIRVDTEMSPASIASILLDK
jgi:hypothetical protein